MPMYNFSQKAVWYHRLQPFLTHSALNSHNAYRALALHVAEVFCAADSLGQVLKGGPDA